ncbi:Ig-like domain-containing protein [Enterobacter hormaechei]|uniref:Ig-like domain-containing protein n=1 Tax=Enterobacter cloacae complex TaxID=354276 RepID=UPI0007951778|nr:MULTISPECIES: Ig-like domain-containing protein [Enterobacter cloacae complex]EHF4922778.1 Ig-like domain-containing protein [Enterobacter hormaechei]EHF5029924.1 Ig-like domain-containing protein [Enterobacter hormaechei]EKK5523173.1 Ig-like domain-containing protein [Enterobacter hormaechei]EKS6319202.1 Ig-like domain-containing protein [Enterobacter hormaechei]ELN4163796.1 Ig-like domain-containing protein [Enterobacter hormaechei]
MSTAKVVDVIIRKTAEKTKLTGEGNLSVSISSPSVIEIQGSAQDVVRYVRQGNDLLIYMKDGSVIRCNNYFVEDTETHNHSELVFNDNQALTHISFADAGEASGVAATELTAQAAPISSIEPFLEQGSVLSDAPWGWIAGAALGGGAIGALLAHGGDGETKTRVIDNTKEVESATPTFLLTDNAGDKQGVLSAKEVTDDNTPTFSGTGQPGATIQVKDGNGSTIASTMVAKDGTWTVTLPTQADGEHTWSVVQIDGSKTTSAGSITVTVSTADTSVTLATTAGDNVINASEQAAGFTLSGTSKNLAQGTALTVTLNGKTYTAEVGANGAWSVKVPAVDAQALGDGTWTVNVSGKDAAGNTVSGSQTIGVDTASPVISVDTIAQDNIINAAEHNQPLTLTGKTDAEAGQIVTVTLNGKNHTATVGSDGSWSVTLPASEVQALANGEHTLTVNVSDKAGNGSSTTADFTVDTAAPVVTINTVAGDDILNTSEQGQAQIISGQANGAAEGDVVTVTVGGKTFTGAVQADGSWSVGVPASVIGALGEGSHSISVSVTDAAGNTGSATHGITLSGNPPEFTLDPISQDNVLNAQEAMQPLSLSGTSNLPNGSAVTVTLNNVNYQATVENGRWSVQVPVSDVLDLANTLYTVSVSGTDSVGNSGSAEANLLVDTVLPQVIVNTFAGDNLVNNAEAAVDQTLSGRVTGAAAGDTVSVTVGGKSYTATVGSDLKWSVTIPSADLQAFGDGDLTFSASVTNAHGNTGTGERDININAELPGLRVNTISGDDVINAIEQQQDLAVTGSSTHLAEGTQITVTINNVEYVTTVNASGNWQIGVPAADLQAWTAGGMTVSVSAEDAWGNTVAAEHPIELDLNAVAVTIDTVTTDDMLNAAEKGADVTLSGQTQGVEAGQTVVVKFADQTFTAQVQQDGSWRLTVPASAMETLIDGRAQVSVSVTNGNGNSADASRVVIVDTQPPAITLDNLTDDNIINAAEAQQDLVLSGSTTAETGQTVTVTLNGKSYQTTVQADGRWQLNVPAADVGALTDGNVTVTATVSDVAGNSSSADRVGLVDATVPQVIINDFVTDTNTVNQLAHAQAQILSGSVTGAAAGDLVTITINNVDYTTVVDAAGNWSLGLPASVVQGLTDGTWTINVSVTDQSGNTGSSSVNVVVNTVTPVIGINTLAADDVINAAEKGEDLLLSGTSNQPEGTTITVNLNGINYTATTDASGNWSVTVPASAVSALGEANYTVTASVTDNVGNSAAATHDVLVDSSLPVVTINTLAGDNIVNAAEVAAGQTLTGKVSNAASGDTVTIILGGQTYTATVQDDLTWSLPLTQSQLTALGNGDLTVSASVTNAHGNTGSSSLDVTIDAQLPGLRIDTVAGDDVINVIEHAQNLVISGTSTDLAAGSTVTVTINGKSYSASVLADGTWQAAVPAADVSRWADGSLIISASAQDTSGNPVNIGTVVDVDLAPVAISINSVTDDNVLNAAEKGQDLVLSGSSSNVEAGQTVTIILAGKTWTTTVDANGDWTCTVPAADLSGLKDGDASVQVSVTNVNGNAASSSQAFSVDTAAPAVTINTISGDNMLNAAEAAQDLTLSGTSTAEAGQTVTVTFNGNQYTAQVQANGNWTLDVPAADLAGITDGSAAVTVTVSDKAGNPASAGASVLVDTTVPQITFNIVAGDDIVNIAEHGQALIVTGKVTGAQAGDVITLSLNGKDYTAMLDASGNWSVGVPATDVGALANGDQTISATLTDKAGNSTSATHAFDVSLTAPVIAINTLAVDDVINATEKGQDLLISGTSNQPDGTRITVTLNGISYAATTDASGNWSVTVPAANVSVLGEASYSVTASVTDTAGNSANTSHSVLVDSALPQVTINAVATDDVINAAEVASGQTLSGKVSGAASGDTVTIGIGGNTYTATVQDDLSWSVNVASDVLTAIGNGDLTVTASVTNGHGNTGTGERDITIDASLPGLRVDTVAGDDVINSIEHGQNLIITGSSDGLASGSALTVTVNGKTYAATVLADGTWTAAIPAADVGALSAGTITVTVDGQSAAGNPVSISHDVKVDLAAVAISINPIASDDVINAAEKGADLVLSGSTTNVEENQTVTITFGGKLYTATVDASGNWTATVPSADLGGLKDGDASVQVSVTNVNGNSASAGREYSVDATAPTVSIEIVSDNNIINAAEAQQDLVVNGVSNAEAGQTVTVTLNGVDYTTTVQANGSWSVTVPSADIGAITDGDYTITAAVADKAGNPASADRDVLVDTTVPQLTINTVSDDDVINSAEHAQALIVTGSVTGAAAGDVVTVTINNKDYTATLDTSGRWSVGVPAADVSALAAGDYTITAALTDKAGNSNSTTHEVEVNLTAPVLTIDTVSGDDVINSSEKTQDLTITGTASGLAAGAVVTVMLNGKAYSATVDTNGQWTTTVPASEVGQLGEALYTVSASATDSVGNSSSTSHTVNVESVLPGVIINTVAGDDVINAAELATGQTISGTVVNAEAGNTVTVSVGGHSYTATVQDNLTWSVSVPDSVLTALGNGDLTVTASVTNGAGNSGSGERDITIDANLPGLRVDTVAGDDVINSIEHGQNLIITGSSDGLTAGTALTVTVNGKTYPATVLADGTWSAAIPSADVSALAAGTVTVNVEGQSSAGNPVTINHDVTVDLANVAISIDAIASDDVINAAERGADLVLSGTTSNVEENQNVTITFGGKNYTATVDAEGKWTATVPSADLTGLKDGDASVQVSVTNVNGNSASAGREYSVDATAPSVTINTIATDDILNASEAQSDLAISGTSTAEAGQTLTVSLNGKDYTTTVSANGSWTLNVPAADLAGLTDGSVTVTAAVSDKAGNPASVDHTLTVDVTVPAVTIHTVAGDDVINVAEHNQAQIISGSATGAAAGDKVTVTIGGQTYTTVLDAAGNWSVGVPASVISGLSDGSVTVTASVTDAAGNTGSGTHNVTVDTGLPSVSFNAISDDNVLNAVEKGQDLSVSGTSANLAEGTVVTVTLNGKNYTATTAADGTWSLTVPAADLAGLGQASYTLSATATNGVGNSVSSSANLLVDTALPTVTINTVAGDNVINAAEVAAGQTLSGTVANAEAGNTVTVTIGGHSYTATVQNNLSWSVNVPSDVLTALGNGSLSVTATVTNGHGNTGTGEREIAIDANLPGLRVNTVAGDDVVNTIEHAQNLIVSGSSDGLAPGTALTVTVNGKDYAATVLADGTWSAAIPSTDVSAWPEGTVKISVTGDSAAGNPITISHDVTVDLATVAISINALATDDVINAAEKGADLVLSGVTTNVEAGQTVTISLNGRIYTTTVDDSGNWTYTVPSADLAGLKDGDASVQVSVTNVNGNSASAGREYSVDATAPSVTINTIATDDILNATEAQSDLAISGTSTAEAGQTLTVSLNGKDYTTTVSANGSWTLNVPAADLAGLTDGSVTVTASVSDKAGNPASVDHTLTVDVTVPAVTIHTVAGDDVINVAEHNQAQIISGSATGAAAGDTVTVTIGGQSYTTVLDAAGNWSVGVPANVISGLSDGSVTVTASVTDAAGNTGSGTHNVTVDTGLPSVSFNAISDDNVLNAVEKGQDLSVSGTSANLAEGTVVTVTLNGKNYTATTAADGTWSLTVPAADLSGLGEASYTLSATATNGVGNSISTTANLLVDTALPTVTINTVAGDNVINGSEAAAGVAISGTTTAEVGQTVTVNLGGNSYTAQVQQGGVWSINVPAADLSTLADNGYTVQVSVSDAAGNPGSAGKAITLDTTPPTVSFNVVAGDDVINSVEHGQAQVISGTATGASVGDKLVITIGSNQYTTTVDASGKWSVGVPASDISALTDGTVTLSATITDSAGNSSTQTHDVVVNTASVALTVNTLSGDDVINAAEAGASLVINGSSAQFANGTQVTITLNGKSYTATIQSDGSWTTTVPAADVGTLADGASYQVSVSAQDSAGNSASATHTISVDTTAPVISVNTLSGDDVLNAAEAQQPLTVHGSSSAEAGQTVTVTLGGKTYTALVANDGTWTLDVPAADLANLSEGALTVTASVNDKAGNNGQTTHTLTVDTVAPAVTISTVADDDIVNNAEQLAGQTISGTTTAEQGQTVTVSFNGHSYQATVAANGSWSVFVPGRDFLGLSDGDYTITATVSDKAGNPGSATHDVTLNGDVPTIAINTFAQDDIVNAAEHGTPLVISGTTDAPTGQTVTITLNGKTYTATVQNDGTWSYTVGSADVTALADGGSYVINAQVSNAIGNSASDNHTVTVDLTAPSMGISIDSLQNDTGLSANDFITNDSQVVVNGSLTAQLGNNEKAQISLDGGTTWIDLTVTGTTWRYTDGRTLTDGTYQYQVRVIDNAGNVGATDSQDVVIDLTKPAAATITVDSVSQDTGLSDSDFITSDNQISLKGTLGAALGSGDHAQISLDGGATWTDVSVSGLSWTYVDGRTLADGDYNYQLRVIDDAGNISATTSQVVTIDTVAPDASKTIAIDSISDDTGLSSSDFITNDTSLTLHGSLGATLADGEYAQISIDGGVTWQNVIVTGNSWYYVDGRTLGNQTYDYYVRVVDAAGNVGASAHQQVTVDTVAPDAAITVTVDNITVDTGFDNNDFLTSSTSYTLNGTLGAELGAGEYVQVSMDGGTTWVYATVSGTRWSYNDTRTLADGDYRYQVRVVDQAGNVGATTTQDVTVDTQAPQYGITIDSISEDTGQSGSDFITMDTSLTINGSLGSALASDERVQISLDGGNTWIDTTVTNQRWSYTDTRDLADGDYTYQVRIIDQAGNVGSTSSQVVTVDTTPPDTMGTVVSYTDGEGERTGTYGASVATDDTSPLINGTLNRAPEDGEIVQLYRDGILLGQVTMNGSASWSYQDNGLLDGNHTYILRVTDKAGNYTESDGFVLNVDTSIPTTTAAITAQTTSDTTPIVSGTVSADLVNGEYLVVTVNGKTYTSQTGGAVVVDPDHNTWYLQIPDSDALSVASYDVTAQVKSSAGNGNTTGTATGSLVIDTTSVNTDWATTAGNSNNSTMTLGMNSSGLWNIIANGQSYSSSDDSTYAGNTLTNTRSYYVVSQTAADFDRNGTQDIFATENTYAGSTQVMWTYDGSSYTASQLAMGTTIWYGGVIAYDKTGDGYLDLAYGDAGMDSLTYLVNTNGVLSPDGTGGEGGFYGQFDSGREISGVDLNNDGTVDIVQHTNRSGAYSLTVINNNGNGTLSIGQNLTNVFVANASNTTTAASMTWADFNGDGYMDLYLGSSYNNNGGVIYYNDGTGQLSTTKSAVEASNATAGYLSVAVDWNGDGQMDIIKLSTYGSSQTATLFTNNGYGSTWTSSQLASGLANVTGVAAVDYNWDGAQDLLVSQQNGKVVLVQNNAEIADGTAMHLHIVDSEGINAYYGNTVNLYNAAGVLVASQIINAQSGIGSNDTSALVSFYGLDPNETYSAEIVKITNGVSDNVTWTGLDAGNGKEGYVLTAEAATGGHSGTITGTGYNDTFIAEDGTYTYNGSGGWNTHSDYDTWSNTGGMDVVDYRNATSGITVDLRLSTAQDTGFGTTRLLNIEGINGSDYDDVITGNSGDNQFEGRGGNDTFNIGSGGHDTLLYKLINASDATGGNGSDVVNGFTVGTWEGTADTDRIDLRDLLSDSGYTGTGSASYVNGVATLDSSAGNIADYIRVVQNGSNTEIQVDLDGTGGQFTPTTLVTLNGVQTDLATLLANHQLLIA